MSFDLSSFDLSRVLISGRRGTGRTTWLYELLMKRSHSYDFVFCFDARFERIRNWKRLLEDEKKKVLFVIDDEEDTHLERHILDALEQRLGLSVWCSTLHAGTQFEKFQPTLMICCSPPDEGANS